MGLPNRSALSELLRVHFPALHAKNAGIMKWKKFLYKQLCEGMNVSVCKAPRCGVCSVYAQCFGPEEG
jgi:nitrogen fixation protein NifQ